VVLFKKKINNIMIAIGQIEGDYQKIRSGATRSQIEAPAPGTPGVTPGTPGVTPGTPGVTPGTPGVTPGTPGVTPGTPGTAGANYVDALKKYAPYAIVALALYYFISKK
jgi:hypothetical protein